MSASTQFIFALLAGLIPSLVWLFFWIREDSDHPEPKSLIIFTFFAGMVSVLAAILVERSVAAVISAESTKYILWALAEEIIKFVAVFIIAINSDWNDEPIDAMVYCIIAALGFAAVENTLFALSPSSGGSLAIGLVSSNLRFLGATVIHVASSASIGFALGLVFYKGYASKIFAFLVGLGAAVGLHAAFNLSIINATTVADALTVFAWFWGSIVILIVLFEEIKNVRPRIIEK